MPDRDALIDDALASTRWATWRKVPIAQDASARRYFRLFARNSETVILADVPPDTEDFSRFLHVATILSANTLCAPKLIWAAEADGVFLLSDLGPLNLAEALDLGHASEDEAISALLSVLLKVREIPYRATHSLTRQTAVDMLDPLFADYGATGQKEISAALSDAFDAHVQPALKLSLRDFHSENLIWRAQAAGAQKLGLLDFQDAFLAPEGYDLVSFTRDVRRDVPKATTDRLQASFATELGLAPAEFALHCAILAVQRNLRILGVFSGLIAHGKQQYSRFLPRVWRHIQADLQHPALSDLRRTVDRFVPEPSGSTAI